MKKIHTIHSFAKYSKSFDGARIYYELHQNKIKTSCLVFLHGLGGNLTGWNEERAYFDHLGISTIAVDLRGHGLSEKSDKEEFYSFENFTSDILTIMRTENFKDYVLIGHCFGGMISMMLEGMHPKTSRCLVLVDTSYKPSGFLDKNTNKIFLFKILSLIAKYSPNIQYKDYVHYDTFLGTNDYDLKRIATDILHTSLRSYFFALKELIGYDATDFLRKILVPTLIIEGSNDSIFPPDTAKALQSRIKTSYLKFIEGGNHLVNINKPKDVNHEIEKFLKKVVHII